MTAADTARRWDPPPRQNITPAPSEQAAVAFVDLSGFTAVTDVHGDFEAADMAEAFAAVAHAALGEGDRLVKAIGDAVLLTSPTADAVLPLITRITEATHAAGRFPVLRTGVAYGPIVERHNDIYGATVNIAARLAAAAGPGQMLATDPIAAAAQQSGLIVTNLGPVNLRNLTDPVAVFAIDLGTGCHCAHVDPVCRIHLHDPDTATSLTYRGITYRFCSTTCAQQFSRRPNRFNDPADQCQPTADHTKSDDEANR